MADRDRGDARLLRHLVAFDWPPSNEGGDPRRRLEAKLGAELARFLVNALTQEPARASRRLPPAIFA